MALVLWRAGLAVDAPMWAVTGLGLTAFLAERQSVHISSNTQMSVSVLPLVFAAVVYGPLTAMIVGACALLADAGRPLTRWLVWTSSRSIVGGAAGLAALLVHSAEHDSSFAHLMLAVAAAAAVEGVLDTMLNAITASLRPSGSFIETSRAMGRLLIGTVPLYTPVLAVLVYAYEQLSPWTVLLFFVPAAAAQRLLVLYQEQRVLVDGLATANQKLEHATLSFASALVAALDARDSYTAGHSAAVAVYARDIADALGLPPEEQQLAHLCGLLHDIGKVGVPGGILEKNGMLTSRERLQMEQHAVIGERILSNVVQYEEIATIVRHHHERSDGTGYPDGLQGSTIPLLSRVIGVADAYNAMTSGRPYRQAMTSETARARLREAAGSQFDDAVVAAFDHILQDAAEPYRSGVRADFAVEAQRHVGFTRVPAAAAA
jgi:putative nucleotidyltransferase with HDIG domain